MVIYGEGKVCSKWPLMKKINEDLFHGEQQNNLAGRISVIEMITVRYYQAILRQSFFSQLLYLEEEGGQTNGGIPD